MHGDQYLYDLRVWLVMSGGAAASVVAAVLDLIASALDPTTKGANIDLSNGNRTIVGNVGAGGWGSIKGAASSSTTPYYLEIKLDTLGDVAGTFVGAADAQSNGAPMNNFLGNVAGTCGLRQNGGTGQLTTSAPFSPVSVPTLTWAAGDIMMLAVNPLSGSLWFGKNGAWLGGTTPTGGAGGNAGRHISFTPGTTIYPAVASAFTTNQATIRTIRAQGAYDAPSGFQYIG
jgi:hypothetical protein